MHLFVFFSFFSSSPKGQKGKEQQFTAKMGNFTPTPSAPTPCKTSRVLSLFVEILKRDCFFFKIWALGDGLSELCLHWAISTHGWCTQTFANHTRTPLIAESNRYRWRLEIATYKKYICGINPKQSRDRLGEWWERQS